MLKRISRRLGLKFVGVLSLLAWFRPRVEAQDGEEVEADVGLENWGDTHDRVFLGGEVWANPMEDWRVEDGWAVCQTRGVGRNVQSLTHQIVEPGKGFAMSVRAGEAGKQKDVTGVGFRIGVKSELNEVRSNVFARSGIVAGVKNGKLALGRKTVAPERAIPTGDFRLRVSGTKGDGGIVVKLVATTVDGDVLGSVQQRFAAEALKGNVALVSNPDGQGKGRDASKGYRFAEWKAGGGGFVAKAEQKFGPVLWSMYSLSDSRGDEGFVMKLSALTGPMGEADTPDVELHAERDGKWEHLGNAKLHRDAWTATFRIANWDATAAVPFKVVYREKEKGGAERPAEWTGVIRANPSGRPLRLGALTCQNDYGFPYAPVAENLVKLDPDLLYFSGDQIYESHGGFGIIREPAVPAILNYLRKFYQFGWAFREPMRHAPTLCIPDDHDVFHGNIWGEAGAAMKERDKGSSSKGGYLQPARMVNTVHITNCAHHPDFHDPTPVKQDISVYYGDMVYGNVSFAILADRQWKNGPEHVDTGGGRADHVRDPEFDTSVLDKPGLVLLGERQEAFLEKWADDWRGCAMKVVLSQTVFAGVATHHGRKDGYLKADLDSGGWPQTARNRAIDLIRKSKALHVNGDQHLSSLSQYGVGAQRDSNWAFCTPAISAGYPRWWRPDELGMPHAKRPKHGLADTGEYLDGLGNKVYVYAVGNPEVGTAKHRYERAHQKGSGFGLVTIDTAAKTYQIESFRFLIDATDGKASNQFPGWPVVIHQDENAGENRIG